MVALFSLTLFASSCLLFLVEPMFAKMVLPLLGGSPAVWNTCMLFFQSALLAGYAYAHVVTSKLRPRSQIPVHLLVILLPLAVLPIRIAATWRPPAEHNPIPWLVLLMLVCMGLPFFAVSTSASMMQKWFSLSRDKSARDPYFLYAASNAGSIVGLIGYILVLEPNLTLAQQSHVWSVGYGILILLTTSCALLLARHSTGARKPAESSDLPEDAGPASIPLARKLRWIALAFAPSSLMLGLTTFLTTNISAVPLLWIIPLTIYLLTFVFAFSRRPPIPHWLMARLLPVIVLVVLFVLGKVQLSPGWVPCLVHIFMFFVAAMVCHGQLAQDRPHPRHLTGYYLLIAVGGALGGVFNAIVAPLVFKAVTEYVVALVAACMLCSPTKHKPASDDSSWTAARPSFNRFDILVPLALGAMTALLLWAASVLRLGSFPKSSGLVMILVGVLCYRQVNRPVRFGLGIAAMLLAISLVAAGLTSRPHLERSFFGVLRVTTHRVLPIRILHHGTTMHGMQSTLPEQRRTPLAYYYPTGPIGQVFGAYTGSDVRKNVGLIGLGAGALAAYANRGQVFTFYEIDPAVVRIASDTHYFTYLSDARSRGVRVRIVIGDGRLTIARAPDEAFDLIVLDAFSSDAIPVHLLTRQAFRVYLSKLSRHGLIAVHITNGMLRLAPVVGDLAADAGLASLGQNDTEISREEQSRGKYRSHWILLARREGDFGDLRRYSRWEPVPTRSGARVWTDDYSNILQVFRWR